MKIMYRIIPFILLLIMGISSLSFTHPIKLTASLVEYNPEKETIRMECRVFIDDFEASINKTLSQNIDPRNLSFDDKVGIENYFKSNYNISVNGKKIPLHFSDYEVLEAQNVLTLKFNEYSIKLKEGDEILIDNIMFFKEFGELQSNRITIRIPPFIKEYNHESNINTYSFSHTL